MVFLTIDASLRSTGYAVWKDGVATLVGKIVTKKNKTTPNESDAIHLIFKDLSELLDKVKTDTIIIEDQFVGQNKGTALQLSRVRGMIQLLSAMRGIPLYIIEARKIKKIVTDNGNANKDMVCEAIEQIQRENNIVCEDAWRFVQAMKNNGEKYDDIIDAIAIGYAYLHAPAEAKAT